MVGTPVSGNGAPGNDSAALSLPLNVTLWCAVQILRSAGFSEEDSVRALKEIYGVEVPKEIVASNDEVPEFIKRACARNSGLSSFVQIVQTGRLSSCLWALKYVCGALMGDGDKNGRLRVKDWSFVDAYVKAFTILTGDLNAVKVRRHKDGRYSTGKNSFASFIINSGLWKTLAYLDHHDEIKYFLSGLLDAEGSLSPHIHKEYKTLGIQIAFGNTNLELIEFVMKSLKQMGLNPHLYVKQSNPHIIPNVAGGKLLVPRKTVYEVKARVPFSKVTELTKVGFRTSKEAKLFSFFLLIKDLPPHMRYEAFMKSWRKIGNRWKPVSTPETEQLELDQQTPRGQQPKEPLEPELLETKRLSQRKRKQRTVPCPVCQKPANLEIREAVDEKNAVLRIRIHHDGSECMREVALTFERHKNLVRCEKCGELGSPYITVHVYRDGRKQREQYKDLRVRVKHKAHGKERHCDVMSLRLNMKTD